MIARFVLFSLAFVCATPQPAHACRGCKPPSEAELIAAATNVFAATVVSVDKHEITLDVDVIWKGSVAKQTMFATSCWFARKAGAKLIILDRAGKSSKWVSECLQVVRDKVATRARFDKLVGKPTKP